MDAWDSAVREFSKDLCAADQHYLSSTKPEDILKDITDFEHERRSSSKSRNVSARLQPLLNAINGYGKALDVYANASSVLPPIWGSIRVLILTAKRFNDFFPRIVDTLERIGDVLPRYATYATLFSAHDSVREALEKAYLQILQFIAQAMKVLTASTGRTIAAAVRNSFDEAFEISLAQMRRYRELVEDKTRLAIMIEQMEEKERAEIERLRAAENRIRVERLEAMANERLKYDAKTWLNARKCNDERSLLDDSRLEGSCEWILHRVEIKQWLENPDNQVLWVHGAPGCGKSYLYSNIVTFLEKEKPTTYFLFCGGDKRRITLSSLFRSWCLQLVEIYPQALQYVQDVKENNGNPIATDSEIMKILEAVLDNVPSYYLTADAADECIEQHELLKSLSRVPTRFKILITSRAPPNNSKGGRGLHLPTNTFEIQPTHSQDDISRFIVRSLEETQRICTATKQGERSIND